MVLTYVDSSALLRLVLNEGQQDAVALAMRSSPVTSALTRVELRAAIHGRRRLGDIAPHDVDAVMARADTLVLARIGIVRIGSQVLTEAAGLVERYPVRSLDAIHLATAIIADRAARGHGSEVIFCTADRRQSQAAEALFGVGHVAFIPPWR